MKKLTTLFLAASLFSMGQIYAQSKPYLGTPQTIPGVIRPELYDAGGEGVAYHDVTPENTGNWHYWKQATVGEIVFPKAGKKLTHP